MREGDRRPEKVRLCQQLQWDFARTLLQRPWEHTFVVERLSQFGWSPNPYPYRSQRDDVLLKSVSPRR